MNIHCPCFPCFRLAVAVLAAALIGASVRAEVTASATGRATLSSGTTFRDTDGVDETGLGIDQSGITPGSKTLTNDFRYCLLRGRRNRKQAPQ
jgi:opacity protein-like surface antigen